MEKQTANRTRMQMIERFLRVSASRAQRAVYFIGIFLGGAGDWL